MLNSVGKKSLKIWEQPSVIYKGRLNGRWKSFGFYASETEEGGEWESDGDRDSQCCEALPSHCLSSQCLIGLPPPSIAPSCSLHPSHPPLPAVTKAMGRLPLRLLVLPLLLLLLLPLLILHLSSLFFLLSHPPHALPSQLLDWPRWRCVREREKRRGGGAINFNSSDGSHLFSHMIWDGMGGAPVATQ